MTRTNKLQNLNILVFVSVIMSILFDSIMLCRISVILIFVLCLYRGLNAERYIINPILLFSITPLSLFIYVNLGDMYMLDLSKSTWVIAIINMCSFIIAFNSTKSKVDIRQCVGCENENTLVFQSILFYLLSLIGVVIPQLNSILWIFAIPSIVCAIKSKRRLMMLFVCAVFLISAAGVTSKSAMLTYCLTFIVCFEKYYVKNERTRKMVKLLLAIGVIFMFFSFSFANKERGSYDAVEGLSYYSRGIDWKYSPSLFMPYMYLTNGWTNLQYVMETQAQCTYGLWTLKPLLGYLQVEDLFIDEYKITPYSSFNTCAYMTYGFKDFGFCLSVIMSVILGIFVKRVYSRYKVSKSPYDVASYILVAQATLEMFFSNHFFTQSYPFTIVILMYIVKLIMRQLGHPIEVEKNI